MARKDAALNRLISAATTPGAGTQWGLSFTYDGFGNKLGQTATAGSPPTPNVTVDPQTNRLNGFTYDNNGNQLVTASTLYDVFNRMKTADGSANVATQFRLRDTASGVMRIPDIINDAARHIVEVKNVASQVLTSQIVDMALWANAHGYRFTLYLRDTPANRDMAAANAWLNVMFFNYIP